jgi:predicted RNase H-like nuclease (RuvC/YqgF family)
MWDVMTPNEKTIANFETRLRQMILRFQELKKENQELYAMVDKNEQDIKQLQAKLDQEQQNYNSLKMAKMIEITDGDLDGAKERLSKLIRDVNKCIAILSDQEQ